MEEKIQESVILKSEGIITFPARGKSIDPNEFFNRAEIYLQGSFRERILLVLRPVASTPERTYGVVRLKKNAYDRAIRPDLPHQHLANWEDVASLIEMYPNGKEGYFLFYVEGVRGEVFAVAVHWDTSNHRWSFLSWLLDEFVFWRAGDQVLYPSSMAL